MLSLHIPDDHEEVAVYILRYHLAQYGCDCRAIAMLHSEGEGVPVTRVICESLIGEEELGIPFPWAMDSISRQLLPYVSTSSGHDTGCEHAIACSYRAVEFSIPICISDNKIVFNIASVPVEVVRCLRDELFDGGRIFAARYSGDRVFYDARDGRHLPLSIADAFMRLARMKK